jgi:hypothetical protein
VLGQNKEWVLQWFAPVILVTQKQSSGIVVPGQPRQNTR